MGRAGRLPSGPSRVGCVWARECVRPEKVQMQIAVITTRGRPGSSEPFQRQMQPDPTGLLLVGRFVSNGRSWQVLRAQPPFGLVVND